MGLSLRTTTGLRTHVMNAVRAFEDREHWLITKRVTVTADHRGVLRTFLLEFEPVDSPVFNRTSGSGDALADISIDLFGLVQIVC